jgi:hypothetical protein
MRVDSRRKCRTQKSFCMNSACGHRYHLLVLRLSRLAITLRPAFLDLHKSIPVSIQGSRGKYRHYKRSQDNRLDRNALVDSRKQARHCSSSGCLRHGRRLTTTSKPCRSPGMEAPRAPALRSHHRDLSTSGAVGYRMLNTRTRRDRTALEAGG